ncbi:MuF-C-terminal domain-containing protein, partial [Rodentibacter genomosp. 2]|uniref:MuF-C-terminal domain-containing protein n=1 Tax=Rodentibacter genomosp. 2 TaxID=1908266 RepID=UPI001C4DFC2D
MPKFDTQLQKQLQEYFAPLSSGFSNMLSPKEVAELQKAYGFEQPKPRQLSERDRAARLEAFNTNLATESAEMGKAFINNTANLPAEERYRAWEQAQEALKRQYAHLTEEQQQTALSAFNEHADVFRLADEEAGFFSRAGDALSYIPTTFTKLGEQVTGLVAPESDARKWFKEATDEVENWRSDEAKMRALRSADAMAKAKANGELGFTQFFSNAVENPLETIGQFTESALPTIGAAVVGTAAAPVTGGASLALPFVVGGVQGAGETRNEIYDHLMAMPESQLQQSPQYQALLSQGLTPQQARSQLAGSLIEHGGEVLATGLSSAALSQLGGLARIGQVGKGVLGSTAGKFASELITEPTDEVFQQFMGNKAINDIDPTHSLSDGLGEAAAGGLLFGAAGGAIAAADNAYRKPSEEQIQANSDQAVDDIANNTQPEPQPTQPKSPVNGNVLESVLAGYQSDEARFNELYSDLKSDIEDGRLQQRLKESDREYADLARAYLEQTGQLQSESAVENEQVFADTEVKTTEPEQETTQPVFDEDRLEQYRQASQDIVSAYQRGDITEREVNSRYAEIIQRYPEHQQLAQELYRRQQEDQEQQVLYSRSPMKSVEANIARGRERMTQAILDKADVKRGMYNGEFGWVDFVWGDDGLTKPLGRNGEPAGRGISHIFEARQRKDGMSDQQISDMLVNNIVETIAKGTVKNRTPSRLALEYKAPNEPNGHKVLLTKNKGSNAWVLSGYEIDPTKGRKGEKVQAGRDTSKPASTHTDPTHPRADMGASLMASDSGQFANPNGLSNDTDLELGRPTNISQLNDTHAHSLRGRGVVAENGDNLANSAQVVNQIAQDQQALSRILGDETASHIQVVDRNTEIPSGKDVKKLISVEGWFEISTKKLYLISDNITADETLSRDERLAWVAWHELAHAGVRVKYGDALTRILASAAENVVVKVMARKIQQDRGDISYPVAVEEALVEIYAAFETGNWAALENRYKTKIHESYKQGKNSVADHLTQIANYIRKLMNLIFRNPKFTEKMTTADVFNTLSGIKEGINTLADSQQEQTVQDDVRYSLNENADSDFAKAVDDLVSGEQAETKIIHVGTTPDVLKMLGLPDTDVIIHAKTLSKVMFDKHAVEPTVLKAIPAQINNPVAVMRSSTQQNGYVVLTELTERVNGVDKPIVAALHLKQTQQGIELINIASVYGRNHSQIQRGLEKDLLYWNKEKGAEFLNNFTLQLRSSSLENSSEKGTEFVNTFGLQLPAYVSQKQPQSESNIKTETDLSQYQSENAEDIEANSESNIRYSRKPSVLEQ